MRCSCVSARHLRAGSTSVSWTALSPTSKPWNAERSRTRCMNTPRVILQPRRARPFYGRHPWVYAGAIAAVEGDPTDGAEVDLVSHAGNFVARGLFNSKSKIRVRLYSWDAEAPLDRAFFRKRLHDAIHLRRQLRLDAADGACRLVFSEGDGLSGCIVDRYVSWLVLQLTSLALAQRR